MNQPAPSAVLNVADPFDGTADGPLPEYHPQQLSRTAWHFVDWRDEDPFLLDPPYQRQSVWTDEQRRNLIRSLLMGLPVGSVWTNNRGPQHAYRYAVIDGRQRIETVRAFFAGTFSVPARWFAPDLVDVPAGTTSDTMVSYEQLSEKGKRAARNTWHVSELQVSGLTVAEEARLYLLVNFGGVAQADEDYQRAANVAGQPNLGHVDHTPEISETDRQWMLHGGCGALAVALHDATGWPVVAITDRWNVHDGHAGDGSAMHWTVQTPDGQLVDVDGPHDPDELVSRFHDHADDGEAAAGLASREQAWEELVIRREESPATVERAARHVDVILDRARNSG